MSGSPKVALVCDWLQVYAGAERVIEEILHCYPQAEVFAVVDFVEEKDRHFLQGKPVTTTFIQKMPFAEKLFRLYLPLMPLAMEQLDLTRFDIVISSSHAVAKGVITSPDQIHVSYVHSPLRYAWDMQWEYVGAGFLSYLKRYLLFRMRNWDVRSANAVDVFVANSNFIGRRIEKCYRRDSHTVYPPVSIDAFSMSSEKQDYYVTLSRLVPYKRIDLIVESFAAMPDKRLLVIGDGPERQRLENMATPNVTILGFQEHAAVLSLLQNARAFIFASLEDFGIAPIEAQACGTPVIAFGKGGAMETVCGLSSEKPTGVFFGEQNSESLCRAVMQFEENIDRFTAEACRQNAERFSREHFRENFMALVESTWARFKLKLGSEHA